jgi:sigma-E factor negative regulatory protein RseC
MKETATVLKIEKDIVTVQCRDEENCKACSSMFCKASKGRVFEAVNQKAIPLNEQDKVEVYIDPGKTIKAGFMVLILPLLFFFIMYGAAGLIPAEGREGLRILFGTAGLAGGFLVAYIWGKTAKKKEMPVISAIAEEFHQHDTNS